MEILTCSCIPVLFVFLIGIASYLKVRSAPGKFFDEVSFPAHVARVTTTLAPSSGPTRPRAVRNLQEKQLKSKRSVKFNRSETSRYCGNQPCVCGIAIIHVGPRQTGTTSIQQSLDGWRKELHRDGYALPPEIPGVEVGQNRASNVAYALNERMRDTHTKPLTWPIFLNFTTSSCRQRRNIIMSSEAFAEVNVNITKLSLALSRWQVHIFITYRRLHDWLFSLHYELHRFSSGSGSRQDNRLIRDVAASFVSLPEWLTEKNIQEVLSTQTGLNELEITGLYTSAVLYRYRRYFEVHALIATDDAAQGIQEQLLCNDVLHANFACATAKEASKRSADKFDTFDDDDQPALLEEAAGLTLVYGTLLVAAYRAGIVTGDRNLVRMSHKLEMWHLNQTADVQRLPTVCMSSKELQNLKHISEIVERKILPMVFSLEEFNASFSRIEPKFCTVNTTAVLLSDAWRNALRDLVGEPQPCEDLRVEVRACNISEIACQARFVANGMLLKRNVSFLHQYKVAPVTRCAGQRWTEGECSSSIYKRCAKDDECAGLSQTSKGCHAMRCNALTPTAGTSDRVDLKSTQRGASDPMAICPCLDPDSHASDFLANASKDNTTDIALILCNASLAFLPQLGEQLYFNGMVLRRVTIISKCGASQKKTLQVVGEQMRRLIRWTVSSNVGRCDHGWSEYIATNYADLAQLTLFIKDTYLKEGAFQRVSVAEWFRIPISNIGFRCAYHPSTLWHEKNVMAKFTLDDYKQDYEGDKVSFRAKDKHRPYHRWLEAMHVGGLHRYGFVGWQRPYWPVCYGGGFAASRDAVLAVPLHIWQRLKASMSRGDNIEESHFMERTWAGLLMRVPAGADGKRLHCMAQDAVVSFAGEGTNAEDMRPYAGLMFCPCKDSEKCGNPRYSGPPCPSFIASGTCPSDRCLWSNSACRSCNWQCYLDRYPDLQATFGANGTEGAEIHWIKTGRIEGGKGRDCTCPEKTSAETCALMESQSDVFVWTECFEFGTTDPSACKGYLRTSNVEHHTCDNFCQSLGLTCYEAYKEETENANCAKRSGQSTSCSGPANDDYVCGCKVGIGAYLMNGGFENGSTTCTFEYKNVPSWQSSGRISFVHSGSSVWGGTDAAAGSYFLALQQTGAQLYQHVPNHQVGRRYDLMFSAAKHSGYSDPVLELNIGDQATVTHVVSEAIFTQSIVSYTARSTVVEIGFKNVGPSGEQTVFLDQVAISEAIA